MSEPSKFANCPDTLLVELREAADADIERCKVRIAEIDEEVARRYERSGIFLMDLAKKTHGTITSADPRLTPHGLKLRVERKQTVKWDSEKLQALAQRLFAPESEGGRGWAWEKARQFFKVSFSVPEAVYKAVQLGEDNELRTALDDARTVTPGDLRVSLVRNEG